MTTDVVHEGLEGVLVSETRISHVDGERGRLIVAGHDVEALAASRGFEAAAALVFAANGEPADEGDVAAALAEGRARAFARISSLGDALAHADGMDALRTAVSHLPETAKRTDIVAAVGVFAAAWARIRAGQAPIAPHEGARHAEAILAMLGGAADASRARALDAYLVTVLDHGFNASTFTARVIASTQADVVSAVVGGIGALKGPLHGGAPGPVLELLDAIGTPERARAAIAAELAAGRRIMGMGHRVYRTRDPRAQVLERAIEQLERATTSAGSAHDRALRSRLALARAVEREAEAQLEARYPGRALRANVEFYTAVLLSSLEVPPALFTPLFASARVAGWVAHYDEQQKRGRLIRPSARYVGTLPA
ncbi:MAG: citrate synthase [Polyangiales bacterium]